MRVVDCEEAADAVCDEAREALPAGALGGMAFVTGAGSGAPARASPG